MSIRLRSLAHEVDFPRSLAASPDTHAPGDRLRGARALSGPHGATAAPWPGRLGAVARYFEPLRVPVSAVVWMCVLLLFVRQG